MEIDIRNVINNKGDEAAVGPNTLENLKKLRVHAQEHLEATKSIKTGNTKLVRELFENNLMSSESRFRHSKLRTPINSRTPAGILSYSDSEARPLRRRTRATGRVPDLPNVQGRVLEYELKKHN